METDGLALHRQVQRARYRYASWLALCAGVSSSALLALALWVTSPPAPQPAPAPTAPTSAMLVRDEPVVVAPQIVPPVIIVVQQTQTPAVARERAPFGDLGPCPAPHKVAPRGALVQPPRYMLRGVATAPTDTRWVAAWDAEHVYVTRDGGTSWDRVLDGAGAVLDVAFDCHGRVFALRRGSGLGVREGADETWRNIAGIHIGEVDDEVPDPGEHRDYAPRLLGGGRKIVVLGTASAEQGDAFAAISSDGGASWSHVNLSWYEGGSIYGDWQGDTLRVVIPWTDCMSEGVRMVTITPEGTQTSELDIWANELAIDGTEIHALSSNCPAIGDDEYPAICLWRPRKGWSELPIVGPPGGDEDRAIMLIDGARDVLWIDDHIVPIQHGRTGRARPWPDGATPRAVDLSGRVWGLDGQHQLVRR